MKYLFATNNPGKVREIKAIFQSAGLEIMSLADFGLSFEADETGATFEENATIKATETAKFLQRAGHDCKELNMVVLADDSGLCIDAMGGQPGVDSANFMGRQTPYPIRNNHIIKTLENENNRNARFVCIIAGVWPNGHTQTVRGEIEGTIAKEPRGDTGFGYDPIFFVPEYGKTTAELCPTEKNNISHRGKALRLMLEICKKYEDSGCE